MAYTIHFLLLSLLIFFINFTFSQHPIFPNSIVIPVTKDLLTNQYIAKLHIGSYNQEQVKLVLDINGQFLWLNNCASSHQTIKSTSLQCSMVNSINCGFTGIENNICRVQVENTIKKMTSSGTLVEDELAIKFQDGSKTGAYVTIHHFLFSSGENLLLQGLASGVEGMLGLGNTRISLPSQLSTRFGFQRKFAMCLSSSSDGVLLVGDGSYVANSGIDISKSLMYTPLISNQVNESGEYYINVKSIRLNGMKLSVNSSLFNGGTSISTIVPYTILESRIYEAFVKAYVEIAASMEMIKVSSVEPFEVCYSWVRSNVSSNLPVIDFVLQSEMVKWRIDWRNSMVQVSDEVMCLGFLNGGLNQKASIVIGGHQLEENLLEFNLGTSMLGFASVLTGHKSCSDFSLGSSLD